MSRFSNKSSEHDAFLIIDSYIFFKIRRYLPV